MKILYITTTFSRFSGDPLGGIGNCFYDLYYEIAKYAKVDVVAPLQIDAKKYEAINNLTIYREQPTKSYISFESMIKTKQIFKIPFIIFNLYKRAFSLAKKNDYDIVHGFFIAPAGLIVSLLPGKSKKIISALGSDVHTLSYKPFMPSLYRFIFSRTDGVIYNTHFMKKRLYQLQAKNLEYIPTSVNSRIFKLNLILPRLPNFVFVGRLAKTKGVEILLKAFRKVLSDLPKAKLVIIGDGPEKTEMLKFIQKNKLQESIQLAGTLSSLEISTILKNSYALLLPSFREGTPASILEAMSVGRPIVATKTGSIEQLIDKEVGILTDIGNVDQFANGILKIYSTKYMPRKINTKTKRFDTTTIANQYLNYYKKLINFKNKFKKC